jgi:hypothetical protein
MEATWRTTHASGWACNPSQVNCQFLAGLVSLIWLFVQTF